jgi:Domain of Unknown Function (DUF349)
MDLIARLRPKWRHPDPAVRAAAVRDMGTEEQERLATVAGSDPDAHVRRLAIRKLRDVAVLERVAETEGDRGLRDLAVERVQEVLVETASAAGPIAASEAALARLTEPRSLVSVASAAAHERVAAAALARVSGDRLLREVVRNARHPEIRRAALDRIHDGATLRGIVLGDCPLELALQALERIDDTGALQAIAGTRTAPKGIRQRAQALLASRSDGHSSVGVKEARTRQLELLATVQMLRTRANLTQAAERVREAQREWDVLARDVEPRDDVAEPFQTACDAILREATAVTRRRAEADNVRTVLEDSIAARTALCERIEARGGSDAGPEAARDLEDARAQWNRLPPVHDARGRELQKRFTIACERLDARKREAIAADAVRDELEMLVRDAEALASATPPPASKAWKALGSKWDARRRAARAGDIELLANRFAAAGERLRQRWEEASRHRARLEQENVTRLDTLCRRIEELATAESCKPGTGRRELHAADAALGDLGPLPASERRAAWVERLSAARDRLLRRVAQEEHTDEWRRWANVSAQEEIIARIQALIDSNDLAEGTRLLGRVQEEWAQVASATPDKSQSLWERFRTARNELRKRCDAYLASNLEKKRALCAEVAGLGDSTAWNETPQVIRRLQADWKEIGPVPAKHAAAVWHAFREPCDRFFARRKEHFGRLDEERRKHAEQKAALCEQAEALADSTDWEATATAIKQLQAEWKRIGMPPRGQSEALWQRFRGACDRFFDRRSRREELAREAAVQGAEEACAALEAFATNLGTCGGGEHESAAEEITHAIDGAWAELLRLGPGTLPDTATLADRLRAACERILAVKPEGLRGSKLDPGVTGKRREKLCARLEALIGAEEEAPRERSPQELALALRERLAANTIVGKQTQRQQDSEPELEQIASSWARLGPVLGDDARALAERFERARARVRATTTR